MPNPAIETVRFEDDVAREILAGGDIGSLPRDCPLDRMAADRMKELAEARKRIAEYEAVLSVIADHPTGGVGCNPQTFVNIARNALGR